MQRLQRVEGRNRRPCLQLGLSSKFLSPCPVAERPFWLHQLIERYGLDSGRRDFVVTEAARLAGSK